MRTIMDRTDRGLDNKKKSGNGKATEQHFCAAKVSQQPIISPNISPQPLNLQKLRPSMPPPHPLLSSVTVRLCYNSRMPACSVPTRSCSRDVPSGSLSPGNRPVPAPPPGRRWQQVFLLFFLLLLFCFFAQSLTSNDTTEAQNFSAWRRQANHLYLTSYIFMHPSLP